jgi:2-acylglycerol O-acyltransferase 2
MGEKSAVHVAKPGELLRHRLAPSSLADRLRGGLVHVLVWGAGMFVGPCSPFILAILLWCGRVVTAAIFAAAIAYSFVFPPKESPLFCRLFLQSAYWLRKGSTLWIGSEILEAAKAAGDDIAKDHMVCYHPHGVIPLGFSINGAIRAKARTLDVFERNELPFDHTVSGVQAQVLFRMPLLRHILLSFGCCEPATKSAMFKLFRARKTFGIIPGGSEEVSIHERGKEKVYIRKRAGFLKYALQHGFKVVVVYNFGENDLYRSSSLLRPLNLWLVKNFGFVLPVFWGWWAFPLLPNPDIGLNTVFGAVLDLPKIQEPTDADVAVWHEKYIEALTSVFETHKAQFGYADRTLIIE